MPERTAPVIPLNATALVAETLRISREEQLNAQLDYAIRREAELCDRLDALAALAAQAKTAPTHEARLLAASLLVERCLVPAKACGTCDSLNGNRDCADCTTAGAEW